MFFVTNRKKIIDLLKAIGVILIFIYISVYITPIALANKFNPENKRFRNIEHQQKIDELFLGVSTFDSFFDPKVEILDNQEKNVPLKDFRGKLIILYFFGSWCTSCSEVLKTLDALAQELKFREIDDIVIIPVSEDFKSYDKVALYFKSLQITNLTFYFDNRKKALSSLNITSIPTTFIINKKGYFIFKTDQNINWSDSYLINKLISIKDSLVPEILTGDKNDFNNLEQPSIILSKPIENNTIILH